MKKILILLLIVMCSNIIYSQESIDGNYYCTGQVLIIENNRFKLIMPNHFRNGSYSEVMAEGTIKYVDHSFLELNSDKIPYIEAIKSTKIDQKQTLS